MSRSFKKRSYRKSRRFDKSCRCHGGCSYCLGNRMHSTKVRKLMADEQLKEYADSYNLKLVIDN